MNLSRKWLDEFVTVTASDKDFAEAMTLSGSKVEGTADLGEGLSNVVAGRVESMERHPDSDHMWVCQVDVGGDAPVQICTGAWNVHTGDLMPVALDGATLPGGAVIKKGELRGAASDGMLCSLKELGLDERDFPYAVIRAAAILNDYRPLDPEKPSIPADVQPGHKLFGSVVAARVNAVENAGVNLWKCTLDDGKTVCEMITPCQNVHPGDMVALDAKAGALCTPEDLHARQAEFPHCIEDGIFILHEDGVKPGDDIKPVINADDHVVEFEITPNRPDCLSVIGLAREAAATFDAELRLHEPVVRGGGPGLLQELLDVETPAADLVPRYTARMVRNVRIAPSPKWMRERLRAMGVRPINNIVDITNYVMLEYGQPMHAFDYRYVKGGKIIVRRAREGEALTTLDGNVRKLTANHLVIADETRAVGLAGIMGGENSEIVADTTDVVFESACFDGTCIRKGALALGMRTEASAKFEKGLDPLNTLPAVQRACELVELLGAGEVVDGIVDVQNRIPSPNMLKLEPDRINALLGTDVPADEMASILRKLHFTVEGDRVTVPSWRGDVEGMADLAEEVARLHGYNNIPSTLMRGETTLGGYSPRLLLERRLGEVCRACGYSEIISYSFISPAYYDKIRMPADSPERNSLRILNPLGEDSSIMRTTVLPSMLDILAHNWNYRNKSAKLYEIGKTYTPGGADGLAIESKVLSIGAYGGGMDFFALKGAVEAILKSIRVSQVRYEACRENPAYHPGRCAKVYAGNTCLGVFGQIHPLVARNFDIEDALYAAELDFDALFRSVDNVVEYVPLPRFPSVMRDIAVVCGTDIPAGALIDCIVQAGGAHLKSCEVFDVYTGAPIPAGKKSVAFSLALRSDEQTLTDEHADEAVADILAALKERYGAVIR